MRNKNYSNLKKMRYYVPPQSEPLLLNTNTPILQDNVGTPNGSYFVNDLQRDITSTTIGGDDANSTGFDTSLWDE